MRSPANPGFPPRGLWSLWDMLILDGKPFVKMLYNLFACELLGRRVVANFSDEQRSEIYANLKPLRDEFVSLDLPQCMKVVDSYLLPATTAKQLHEAFELLIHSLTMELDGRKFYGPLARFTSFYEQPKLFGDDIFTKFPSANNDIFEAGTCLALERGTACVMHLMRVCEVGLKALAGALGINVQNDWGAYLREIDKTLEARTKAAGKRTPDEQFYAEARITLDGVRMAWRNPTMHIDHNYSPERAEEILIAVRSLMRHLATKLSETGT